MNIDRLFLRAIYKVLEGNNQKTVQWEEIVRSCFEIFPETFSFEKYTEWPDTWKIHNCMWRCRNQRHWIVGDAKIGISLTENGKIVIYTQFPGVSNYIGEDLKDIKTDMGRMLLCEIVCEAMFRRIAKDQMKKGEAIIFGESDADAYQNLINDLQKKHLNKVYGLVMNYDFESKDGGSDEND